MNLRSFLLLTLMGFKLTTIYSQKIDSLNQQPNDLEFTAHLKNGNILTGKVIKETADLITLNTKNLGTVTLLKKDIKQLLASNKIEHKLGKPLFNESKFPHRTSLFNNAIPLKKNEVFLATNNFLFYEFNYCVTDKFSLGATSSIFAAPFLLNAKLNIPISENTAASVGSYIGPFRLFKPDKNWLAMPYATITQGNKRNNISATVALPFTNAKNTLGINYAFGFMGITGLSKTLFFTYDAYAIYFERVRIFALAPGLRLEKEKKRSAWGFQLAAINMVPQIRARRNIQNNFIAPIPIINYIITF